MDIWLRGWSGENYRSWSSFSVAPSASGVVIVRGRNLDAPTTSGVGKSSLLAAISSTLGVGPPATKATTWGAKKYALECLFDVGERQMRVSRGDRVQVTIGNEAWRGDLAEERLVAVFGPAKVISPLTWRKQRKRGHFFDKTAGERSAFLSEVLDLGRFERMSRVACSEAARIEAEIGAVIATIRRAESALAAPPIAALTPLAADDCERLEAEVAFIEDGRRVADAAYRAAVAEQGEIQKELLSVRSDAERLTRISSKLSATIALASGVCPTCGGPTGRGDCAEARDQMIVVGELLADLAAKESALRSKIRTISPPVEPRLAIKMAELRSARARREEHLVAVSRQEGQIRAREEADAAARREVASCSARREVFATLLSKEKDLASWEREWRASFAAELLTDLTSETNAILARIPNVSSVTVRFYPKETSSGGYEAADSVLVEGEERDDGLSEGQQSSVELACDLALRSVVGGRCANRPRWVVLDEPFEGMGLRDREAFMEWMEEQGDLYLVVDTHSREFSEAFAERGIGVEMSGRRSRIVSAEERASW
ncbi:MAG: hypothetical protein E6Q97_21735 [Desulfurellales bacterium]|nr:MAG: hypothetical protein E6Q97_21735 [Desulfurellales bacterium]